MELFWFTEFMLIFVIITSILHFFRKIPDDAYFVISILSGILLIILFVIDDIVYIETGLITTTNENRSYLEIFWLTMIVFLLVTGIEIWRNRKLN